MLDEFRLMMDELAMAGAAYRLFRDPTRLQDVLDTGTRITAGIELEKFAERLGDMAPWTKEQLRTRRVLDYDPVALGSCAPGTLGRAVHDHCAKWEITPKTFENTRTNDTPGQHILVHIENTHDIWHPVMAMEADPPGEVGVQAFYMGQMPNLLGVLCIGIAHFRVLKYTPLEYPTLMDTVARGWILGKRALPLFGVPWEEWFDRPLVDVRRELHVDVDAVKAFLDQGTTAADKRTKILKGLGKQF